MLPLPDRRGRLDVVDQSRARRERLDAVARTGGGHQRDIPRPQRLDAVRGGDVKARVRAGPVAAGDAEETLRPAARRAVIPTARFFEVCATMP